LTQNLKFDLVTKDRLFYNKYTYAVGFELAEAAVLKRLDHDHITRSLERRRSWREHALQRPANTKHAFPWTVTARLKEITQETESNLHIMCDLLLASPAPYKLVTSGSQAWIYTNQLSIIKEISEIDFIERKVYTQAQVNRPTDTIILKNAVHQARSYFRTVKLDVKDAANLRNFLTTHQNNIRLSPALLNWVNDTKFRMSDYFFIDYTEETWLTMLSLVRPGLIRKSIKIIPAK
jgi:hypothetical protein